MYENFSGIATINNRNYRIVVLSLLFLELLTRSKVGVDENDPGPTGVKE